METSHEQQGMEGGILPSTCLFQHKIATESSKTHKSSNSWPLSSFQFASDKGNTSWYGRTLLFQLNRNFKTMKNLRVLPLIVKWNWGMHFSQIKSNEAFFKTIQFLNRRWRLPFRNSSPNMNQLRIGKNHFLDPAAASLPQKDKQLTNPSNPCPLTSSLIYLFSY